MAHPLELIHPRSLKHLTDRLQILVRTRLWLQIVIGMVLGVLVGILLGPDVGWLDRDTSRAVGEWLALPGYLFLAMIQMIVVPLVVASIIRGIAASEDVSQLKRMGWRLLLYFVVTTVVAICIGIAVGLLIKPGAYIDPNALAHARPVATAATANHAVELDNLPRRIVDVIPTNPLAAMLNADMLSVVMVAFITGIALINLNPTSSKPLLELLGSVQSVCMTIVGWVMLIAPLAVFGLLAQVTMKSGLGVLLGLGVYVVTVAFGLGLLMVFYLLLVWLLGRFSPWKFLVAIRDAQLLAFSTDSSAAVMPVSLKSAEEGLKVRPSIAQFIIPVGATVNMGGTALYQGLATIFMAQAYGMGIPVSMLLALIVTAVGASIGTPATPGVGIVVLSSVLTSAGVPIGGLGLIIGVDRILEMGRTVLNVTGDLTACTVMDRLVGGRKTFREEMAAQRRIERQQERTGEDVITTTAPQSPR